MEGMFTQPQAALQYHWRTAAIDGMRAWKWQPVTSWVHSCKRRGSDLQTQSSPLDVVLLQDSHGNFPSATREVASTLASRLQPCMLQLVCSAS